MSRTAPSRWAAVLPAGAMLALALAACTSLPPTSSPTDVSTPGTSGGPVGANVALPSCDSITAAIGTVTGPLAFDQEASLTQTAPEAYDQRVCVYRSADTLTQLGITIAAIPFQQTEIDSYATQPNAIADERLAQYDAVLQTLAADDGADGHLDSPLYLFDTRYSITVQAVSTGEGVAVVLPDLSVEAATDAAFAVRALL